MNRSRQRGLSFLGFLFWCGAIGGIYYGSSIVPIFVDDYLLKNEARGVANEWLGRVVFDPAVLERRVREKALAQGIDPKTIDLKIVAEEGKCSISVAYRRVWKLRFTEKAYARKFAWVVKQERG
jgi:hypothetical protein